MFTLLKVFHVILSIQYIQTVLVKIDEGWLRGAELQAIGSGDKYYSFKGIPYAKAPLAELRFKAPQPPERWLGIRDATKHGSICIQYSIYENKVLPGSEDCLFLNVYSKHLNRTVPAPVMIFIHEGGFKSDSGNDDLYGPDFLVTLDVVLVTFNYRLEVLGYLQLDIPEVPGNAGMKDQVAVLKWVRKNIRKFGGDPNNVTIFGQSAGGASAGLHMISPLSKGLFKRAIAMSGVPFCDFATPFQPRRKAFILGAQLGLQTQDPYKLLEFLQRIPAEKLLNVNVSAIISEDLINLNFLKFNFVPTIEKELGQDHFLTEEPIAALKKGHVHDVDFMAGHTSVEYLHLFLLNEKEIIDLYKNHTDMFAPAKLIYQVTSEMVLKSADRIKYHYLGNKPIDVTSAKEILNYFTESKFGYDLYRFMKHLHKVGNSRRYYYIFSCQSRRNIYGNEGSAKYNVSGAAHMDDLAYLFNPKKLNLPVDPNSKEYKLILQLSLLYTNFARYGNPTPFSTPVKWQQFDTKNLSYMDIGEKLTLKTLDKISITFWKSIYDDANVEF